jgi:hypothetical protein
VLAGGFSTPAVIRSMHDRDDTGRGTSGDVTVTNSILAGNNGGNGRLRGPLTTAGGYT